MAAKKPRPDVVASQGGLPSASPAAIQAALNEAKAKKLEVLDALRHYRDSHKLEVFEPHPRQALFFDALQDHTLKTFVLLGGNRCLAPGELIFNPVTGGHKRIDSLTTNHVVLAWDEKSGKMIPAAAGPSFPKGEDDMFEVTLSDGSRFSASGGHRILLVQGLFAELRQVQPGCELFRPPSIEDIFLSIHASDDQGSFQTTGGSRSDYPVCPSICDGLPLGVLAFVQDAVPSQADVQARIYREPSGDLASRPSDSHLCPAPDHLSTQDGPLLLADPSVASERLAQFCASSEYASLSCSYASQTDGQSRSASPRQRASSASTLREQPSKSLQAYSNSSLTVATIQYIGRAVKWDFHVPIYNNYYHQGCVHHNSGKTEAAVAAALSLAMGRYPWVKKPQGTNRANPKSIKITSDNRIRATYDDGEHTFPDNKAFKLWQSSQLNPPDPGALRWPGPIKIRMLAEDMTALEQVTLPKFRKLCAPEWVAAKKKNSFGIEVHWIFTNGSVIDFLTFNQDQAMLEGWDGHVVLYDEPPPRSHYIANLRGLVDHSGLSIFSMTPLSQPWVNDEIVNKVDNSVWTMIMRSQDNPHIKKEDLDQFASSLTDDEKETRLEGKFLHLQGLCFRDFDKKIHVRPCREPPKDSTVFCAIDPHARTPHALTFMWTDRKNNLFVSHDIFKNGTPEQIAEWVITYHDSVHPIEQVLIDPYAKGDKNRGETTYEIVERLLSDEGIPLDFGSKDLSSGILMVQDCLKSRNGIASLFIDPSCERTIWEVQRIVWADWKNAGGADKEQMNKPVAKDNHMWENIRRLIQYPIEYRNPRQASDFAKANQWRPSDDLSGY